MRFFSHEWAALDDDAEVNRVIESYNEFFRTLPSPGGDQIRAFERSRSLNAALLDRLVVLLSSKTIEFTLIAGDLQTGYSLLTMRYLDAYLDEATAEVIAAALNRRNAQIRYNEFDFPKQDDAESNPRFVHRFLLWPRHLGSFAINFRSFDLTQKPLEGRGYETYGVTFEITPA